MIKINNLKLDATTTIYLPEAWHEMIMNDIKGNTFPYEFTYIESVKNNDIVINIFKGAKNKHIGLTNDILRYLFGSEVPDTNIGFSFKEYLPNDKTDILVTNIKNPNNIIPATLIVKESIIEIEEYGKIPSFDFYLDYQYVEDIVSLSYYTTCEKATWKFLFNKDISYMSDCEKTYQDTYVHKKYVMNSCRKLSNYLNEIGMVEHAKMLMERAYIHDNSKVLCADETRALSMIINDKSCLSDANKALSQIKTDAIQLHWKHNSHHPEHYKNYADMSKLDIMEMCCDWHARSVQYGTNLLEFLEIRQKDRFHFPEYMYLEIKYYCEILLR